jgi:hypothetical protein
MSGPAHSSIDTVEDDDEAEDDDPTTRYRLRPSVEGSPYSLAMHSSIDPMVGWRGSSLPLFHLRFFSSASEFSRFSGGITVSKCGEPRVAVRAPIEREGDELGEGAGRDGMTMPNDWAIRPSCPGVRGRFGGA